MAFIDKVKHALHVNKGMLRKYYLGNDTVFRMHQSSMPKMDVHDMSKTRLARLRRR